MSASAKLGSLETCLYESNPELRLELLKPLQQWLSAHLVQASLLDGPLFEKLAIMGPSEAVEEVLKYLGQGRHVLVLALPDQADRIQQSLDQGAKDAMIWTGANANEFIHRFGRLYEELNRNRELETDRRDLSALLELS